MAGTIHAGDRVLTPDFGEGVVKSVSGRNALIAMDDLRGMELKYEVADLELLSSDAIAPDDDVADVKDGGGAAGSPIALRPTAPIPNDSGSRLAIEALRFGLVPAAGIERVTLGFAELSEWVESRMPYRCDDVSTFSEVCGPFGTGKSHTMAVVRHVAERLGYVTGRVSVDGQSVSLSDPARLLASLWSSLRVDGMTSVTPLLDLYVRAIELERSEPIVGDPTKDKICEFYRAVRELARSGCLDQYGPDLDALISSNPDQSPSLLAYQIGREANLSQFKLRRMISTRITDRPYDFVQALVGHALLAQMAGHRGLIVTIDEFEIEHLNPKRMTRAGPVLDELTQYLEGSSELPPAPLGIFVASVGQEGHAGDERIDAMVQGHGVDPYELKPLETEDIKPLADRIHSVYCDSYGIEPVDGLSTAALDLDVGASDSESGFTRAFIKAFVSLCDATYGPCGYERAS